MTADWFGQRRFGIFVHMAIASVPAFAPVHEYAEWYWSHLSPTRLDDVILHPAPMPEVQDWHRRHYGDARYDDFIPGLTMSRWDADELAELVREAGAGYIVHTTKHHDGYCFFDSAFTDRTSVRSGPRRDVVAELAAAARRVGIDYGVYYSLLDWSHPAYGTDAYVTDHLHPQVRELITSHAPAVLWGDGHWGRQAAYWRSDELLATYADVVPTGVVNDRWGASRADFATFEYETPTEAPAGPFEVCRGIGYSFGWNRAERVDDHLSAAGLVALLTETVAKGGNLLVDLGPRADGSIPAEQRDVLQRAGRWVRTHADAIDGTVPFDEWGGDTVRYTVTPDATSDGRLVHVNAIDLGGAARPRFGAVTAERFELVDAPADWTIDGRGLTTVRRTSAADLAEVYRVTLRRRDTGRITVQTASANAVARIGGTGHASIADALDAAVSGETVEVADGVHAAEPYPLHVPAGVTLRGHRTAVLDAGGRALDAVIVLAGDGAAVRGMTIRGVSPSGFLQPAVGVRADGVTSVTVAGTALVQTSVLLSDATGATIIDNDLAGGGIRLTSCHGAEVRGNAQRANRWGTGIAVDRSEDVVVADNDVAEDLSAIHLVGTRRAVVAGNRVATRWWGIHVDHCDGTAISRNVIDRTMRAVCITGGDDQRLIANAVTGCDSALLVEAGARRVTTTDNTFADCRLSVLVSASDDPVGEGDRVLRARDVDPHADLGNDADGSEHRS